MGRRERGKAAGKEATGDGAVAMSPGALRRGSAARTGAIARAALALLGVVPFGALALATPVRADTGAIIAPSDPESPQVDSGWQAGTCYADAPTCSVATPGQFFEQAAGHPQIGFTQFIVKNRPGPVGPEEPVGELKTVRVDLPVGLTVNPQATPQCPPATFESNPSSCPAGSAVGTSFATGSLLGEPTPTPLEATVYNLVPPEGEPARFGFELAGNDVYLRADVAWQSDYHEGFTIDVPRAIELEPLIEGLILKNRLVFDGRAGDGTFITTPTTCLGEALPSSPFAHAYSTWLLASSVAEEEDPGYSFPEDARPPFESRIPPSTFPKECGTIPFRPSLEVDLGTALTDSPSGVAVEVRVPGETPSAEEVGEERTKQASSQLEDASVTTPPGMGLDPSAANGLVACTDAEFGKGTTHPVECPPASRIGTVSVQTPPLPPNSLAGDVYLGQQLSRDPASGEEYRIFADVESARYGISARLVGHVAADPATGRLTATFADDPQVPFSSFRLQLDGGPRAPLTGPSTCGPHVATSRMVPWSSTPGLLPAGSEGGPSAAPPATPSGEFDLTAAPGGGACPKTLATRPFAPGFGVGVSDPQAGAFSSFHLRLTRSDGEQELKGATLSLPPGLTAKLASVAYCPEAALAAAAARSGAAESAHPSCPASSLVGAASILAGSGEPLRVAGKVFLAGPYRGAPLSLAIVTPATAGPFDLGSVVVRVALFVDPATAQVSAVSDPIPHVFGGALLDLRSISVDLNRPDFSLNPTSCAPLAVAGTLLGGGANPADPAAFGSVPVSAPFQVSGCEGLGFGPKLGLRLFGATRRAGHPRLRAVFAARPGDANPARVAVTLPHALFLDQASISKVCTRIQFAAGACPRNSVYGYARAFTPLLDRPLEGPVYLRSSDNLLPDLVAALHGQVDIVLDGKTDSVGGRIRNTFDTIPDVPVSRFVLTLRGGRRGLLVNSRNLCPRPHRARRHGHSRRRRRPRPLRAVARIVGQNGKTADQRPKLGVACRARRHRHHRSHRHHHQR